MCIRDSTNPAYTDLIIPNYQVKKIIHVSDRAASYSAMRYCHGFAIGSGYRSFDSNYSDIISLPVKNGVRPVSYTHLDVYKRQALWYSADVTS